MQQVINGQRCSQHLADHRCHRSPHHAPMECKDKNRIQYKVERRTGQRGEHGKFGTSVGTDDRVHRLAEHIKRDSYRNVQKVFFGLHKRFFIDTSAEHGQDRVPEYQIQRRYNCA